MKHQREHNNTSILDCEDEDLDKMPEKAFKRLIVRLLKNTEKQLHELKKLMHATDEKFIQEIEILKNNQIEILRNEEFNTSSKKYSEKPEHHSQWCQRKNIHGERLRF